MTENTTATPKYRRTLEEILVLDATPTPLVRASAIKVGDVVSPMHAKGYPDRVVKVGPLTKTGRVTIYFGDSRSTCRAFELWHSWPQDVCPA